MNAETYSSFSNLAMVTAWVVYLLAAFGYAGEWAAARRGDVETLVEEGARRDTKARDTRAAVLVGGGAASAADTRLTVPDHQPTGTPLTPTERGEVFGRIGTALMGLGFVIALAGVTLRSLAAGRPPWGNMYEFTTTAMLFIVAVFLVLVVRSKMRWLGLPIALLAAVGNGVAVTLLYVGVAPLVPALHSVWFVVHIVCAAIAGSAFNVGGVLSIMYLVKHRAERRGVVTGYLAKLPSTAKIDVFAYRCLAFAFPLWTFTIAAGAVWAQYAWGRFWGWDPKETWALITWVIYACYLHARATAGWKGNRAAVIAILGFAAFWFNFVIINLLVSGLHSYAGV